MKLNRSPSTALILSLVLSAASLTFAQAPNNPASPATASTPAKTSPSAAEIAAAKASHKVWVNLDSGIYHK